MTRYYASIHYNDNWEDIAEFSNKAEYDAVYDFCISQFSNGNSLVAPADNIAIFDAYTGEKVWDFNEDESPNEEDPYYEPDGIDDDMGYDPYLGCYTDDC